jgi:D-psicose/D-tagatose/L-ribulose 3-epimerase
MRFKHAICNEAFEKWDFAESCRVMKKLGYQGIEIAPFTLADDPVDVSPTRRKELRDIIVSEGLEFVGLHWLMVSKIPFHVTTPDVAVRQRGWQHIDNLIDLCADLGEGGVMVFGSPKQRSTDGKLSREEATKNFLDALAGVARHAEQRGVTILIEALPSAQTDVILSLDEAAAHVKTINSPAVRTMFDTHNAVEEVEAHTSLIERHYDLIRHVHVNEDDGRHPGTGNYDFVSLFRKLHELNYQRWISLEAFDFSYGAERLASESIGYLNRRIEEALAA